MIGKNQKNLLIEVTFFYRFLFILTIILFIMFMLIGPQN
jgi:hypothetical protein